MKTSTLLSANFTEANIC